MPYKTILVHVDHSKQCTYVVRLAATLAMEHDAHLIGIASTGIAQFIRRCNTTPTDVAMLPADLALLTDRTSDILQLFEEEAEQLGVLSVEARRVDDSIEDGLRLHARYADLLVLRQPEAHNPHEDWTTALAEQLLLHCARPILMVPYAGRFKQIGQRVVLGWDGGIEATRAITAALPLLQTGRLSTLAILNPAPDDELHGLLPGVDMARYLARQEVAVEVLERRTSCDIGAALLSLAAEVRADLLVLGAYSHSHLRELALGGVTRTILRDMSLPVLWAH